MAAADRPRPLLITRWTSREGLAPRALRGSYVGIDERGFAEILAESVHFSRFLHYFDARNVPDGTWEALLTADQTAVLALLATLGVESRSAAVTALVRRVRREPDQERQEELLRLLIGSVLRLAVDIDNWLGPAQHLGEARHLLEQEIREVLAPRLRALVASVALAEREGLFSEKLTFRVEGLRSIWLIEAAEAEARSFGAEGWIDALLDDVVDHIDGFVAGVASLAARSAAAIDASLEDDRHAPHAGLLMAFIRLFRHAQAEINTLPGRIASFYQEAVLRERPRPALPDRTFVAFKPIPGGAPPEIPAGMLFPAGKDEAGTPIEFAADRALALTGARLADLRVWQPVTAADGTRLQVNAAASPVAGGRAHGHAPRPPRG
jgi:hypothetical protein